MPRRRKGAPTSHPHDPAPAAPGPGRQTLAAHSSGDISPRLALPSDLPASLRHLDDTQLDTLLHAVEEEARRRRPTVPEEVKTAGTRKRNPKAEGRAAQITPGQINVIRAAFEAGVKPSALARQFRISRAQVDRIVGAAKKGRS